MLSTALDKLTTLTSRQFILGAFVPVLVFAFLNGTLLYQVWPGFRTWVGPQIGASATASAFAAAAAFVGIAVAAYIMWSLNGFLLRVLEGRYVRPDSKLEARLVGANQGRRHALREGYREALREAREIGEQKTTITGGLTTAAATGIRTHPGINTYDGKSSPAAMAMIDLRLRLGRGRTLTLAALTDAAAKLESALEHGDIRAVHAQSGTKTLSEDRLDLLRILDGAAELWQAREAEIARKLQTHFGPGAVSPTALGNISESVNGYARSRYHIDLETFWSRLQPMLQNHEAFYGSLQEAKSQLDFLVGSIFLSGLTTVIWFVVLPLSSRPFLFAAVAILGPIVTRMLYRTAVENYLSFSEVTRTAVDLYRFELLDALGLPRPGGLRDERRLWEALGHISSFGIPWADISYARPGSAEPADAAGEPAP